MKNFAALPILLLILFLSPIPVALAASDNGAPRYQVTVIAPLPGLDWVALGDINNSGHAVGASGSATSSFRVPVIYRNGQVERLADFRGAAVAVNDFDQVIGYFGDEENPAEFLWTGGPVINLTQIAGENLLLVAINNRGEISGRYHQLDPEGGQRVFMYRDGVFRTLGAWPGAQPTSMNNLGQIAGFYDGPDGLWHAVLFRDGGLQELGGLPGAEMSIAYSINDRGDVAGGSFFPGVFQVRTFLYRNGKLRDIGTLGDNATSPLRINNSGDILGISAVDSENFRVFLYHHNKMHDLNDLILPNSRWQMFGADSINDRGEIIGTAIDRENPGIHTVLLTPVDPPKN